MYQLRDWWCPLCLATSVHYVVKPHTWSGANLELTEITDTGAFQSTRGGSPVDRTRTIQGSCSATRHDPARRGGYRQRRHDVPVLRDLAAHLLPLAAPLPEAGA